MVAVKLSKTNVCFDSPGVFYQGKSRKKKIHARPDRNVSVLDIASPEKSVPLRARKESAFLVRVVTDSKRRHRNIAVGGLNRSRSCYYLKRSSSVKLSEERASLNKRRNGPPSQLVYRSCKDLSNDSIWGFSLATDFA